MKKILMVFLILSVFAMPAPVLSEEGHEPSGEAVTIDLVFMRPAGLVSIVVGTGIFIIAIPFTVPTGSVRVAAKRLIKEPFIFTFVRPVGEGMPDYED